MRNSIILLLLSGLWLVALGGCLSGDPKESTVAAHGRGGLASGDKNEDVDLDHVSPNQSIDGQGTWAAEAKDLWTGVSIIQTGFSMIEAQDHAMRLCRLFSEVDGQCVLTRVFTTRLSPTVTNDFPSEWTCLSNEMPITGIIAPLRYWAGRGSDIKTAQEKALWICRSEAGNGCYIYRCFNSDRDKIR